MTPQIRVGQLVGKAQLVQAKQAQQVEPSAQAHMELERVGQGLALKELVHLTAREPIQHQKIPHVINDSQTLISTSEGRKKLRLFDFRANH